VAIDLARELARRLGAETVFVGYATPGEVAEGVGKGWDIAFVAADPDRAQAIAFTPPYLEIDATYLVPASSSVRTVGDMDRAGAKIATGATSAYTLVLKRDLKQAQLVLLANDAAVAALQGEQSMPLPDCASPCSRPRRVLQARASCPTTSRVRSRQLPCPRRTLRRWRTSPHLSRT
jgi:polar amino acid transport system substrate-binding protein